jgi:hypothetical protein
LSDFQIQLVAMRFWNTLKRPIRKSSSSINNATEVEGHAEHYIDAEKFLDTSRHAKWRFVNKAPSHLINDDSEGLGLTRSLTESTIILDDYTEIASEDEESDSHSASRLTPEGEDNAVLSTFS